MTRRQTRTPMQWLIADARNRADLPRLVRSLPIGSGVILVDRDLRGPPRARLLRQLRSIGRARDVSIVDEADGSAARVHDAGEIARARLAGASLLLVSPLFATRSHPDQPPLPRMRAAALARLAGDTVLALGGMDRRRFVKVKNLGFDGWAAIDAWDESA